MPLPDFKAPPVVEVVLSVQFVPLAELTTVHIGKLWASLYEKEYPVVQEHPPLPAMQETFEPKIIGPVSVSFQHGPPPSRLWFLNADGTELLQIQRDQFIHNWRQAGTGKPYPRYTSVRDKFLKEFGKFCAYVEENQLGKVEPNQCEVTYVNEIDSGKGWESFGEPEKLLSNWQRLEAPVLLGDLEDTRITSRYIMKAEDGTPLGRLHVNVEPRYRVPGMERLYRMTLTARGAPYCGDDGVAGFLDVGHIWIVRGFADVTTGRMHEVWGRSDDR